jgi:transcription elongation factor Elf1
MAHRRYLRQESARYDKAQAILTPEGVGPNPRAYSMRAQVLVEPQKKVTCPFCLGLEEFRLFLVSTKKGLSRSLAKCPLCLNGMRLKTLVDMLKWDAKKYAEFVAPYASDGFWKKCKFDVWKKRLLIMGWTQEFWDRYHELRGQAETESFSAYMSRKGREEADEYAHSQA